MEQGASVFRDGSDFDETFETTAGPVGVLAEVEIRGEVVVLRDLLIYPTETDQSLPVGVARMLEVRRWIEANAEAQGFSELRVTAKRLSGASPGRMISFTRRLR